MHIQDIEKVVLQGESDVLEFKKSTSELESAARTLCAFLNQKGGMVLLGISNNGKLLGQDISDGTRQEIARTLHKFEPSANIDVRFITLPNDKQVIALHAEPNTSVAPYVFAGKAYIRLQSVTSTMPQKHYEQLLLTRMQKNVDWESLPAKTNDIDALDRNEIRRTIAIGIQESRIPPEAAHEPIEDTLMRLKVIENGQLLNAAMILFLEDCFPSYGQCFLKMARVRGNDNLGTFIDNRQIHAHAFKVFDEAMMFVQRHLPLSSHFEKNKVERHDKFAIPLPAIREALVNAICHRDYSASGGHITLTIYDTYMEIWSYGSLPGDLTLDDLKRKHKSYLRNKTIANVFYHRGLIERWGSGTLKIIETCKKEGIPEPDYESYSGGVAIIFRFEGLARRAEDTACNQDKSIIRLSLRQKEIIEILKKHGQLSLTEILGYLIKPPASATVYDDLAYLKQKNIVDTSGHGRGAIWYLKKIITGE